MNTPKFEKAVRILEKALVRAQRRIFRLLFWRTLLWCCILILATCLALISLEKTIYLPALWRIVILGGAGALLVLVLFHRIWQAVRKHGRLAQVAREIDRHFPHFKNRLEAALEFVRNPLKREIYSAELIEAAVCQASELVKDDWKVRSLVSRVLKGERKKVRIEGYAASVLLVVLLAFSIADPFGLYQVFQNYCHPVDLLRRERAFRIFVHPGNITILRGDSVQIRAVGTIHRPEDMVVHFWQAGRGKEAQSMTYRQDQFEYNHTFQRVENDLSYYVQQRTARTDTFRVRVTNNPFVTELVFHYDYPAYTALPRYETARDKAIQALRGTRVVLSGRSSNPLVRAEIVLEPDSVRPAAISGERNFSDTLYLQNDGGYRIRLEDCWGLANSDTLVYPITVIPDELPAIVLRFPGPEAQVDERMKQPLLFEVADDFGVSKVELHFQKQDPAGQSSPPTRRTIASWKKARAYVMDQYVWDLKQLRLLPEDVVTYRLFVFDNDRVSGPKSVSTPEYRIRFPSLEDIFDQEQQRQEEIVSNIQQLGEKGEKLREQVRQMSEAIERGQKVEWEEGRKLDQAVREQVEMLEQVRRLAKELQESIEQMERGNLVSSDVIDKLTKVQQLLEDVTTDRMKEVMEKLQQALDKLDQQELSQTMENLEVSQEQLLEKLDRTLALLEKLRLEQQMDYLVNRTEELAREAAEYADSTAALLGEPLAEEKDTILSRDGESPGVSLDSEIEITPDSSVDLRAKEPTAGLEKSDDQAGETAQSKKMKGEESELDDSTTASQKAEKMKNLAAGVEYLAEKVLELDQQTVEFFEQLAVTSQNMEQAGEKELAEKLNEEGSRENRKSFRKNLSAASNAFRSGRLHDSVAGQGRVTRGLQKMHQRMKEYRDEFREKSQKKVARAMERAFDELSYLSGRQEDILISVAQEPDINHPDVLEYASEEQDIIEGLVSIRDGLIDAARDNFFVSGELLLYVAAALGRGEESLQNLQAERRRKTDTVQSIKRSLATINASMMTLLRDRGNMEQSTSITGIDQVMARLEALAERQQKLNEQIQSLQSGSSMPGQEGCGKLLPSARGASGTGPSQADLMRMLRQMAAEQKAIRDQVAELAGQMAERKEILGSNMEGVIKDAEEVVKDMLERGVTQETLERQRRIFNRLMDAQKSIQQRDTGRRRKSKRPGEYTVKPPEALARELLESSQQESLLKSILQRWEGAYPESFEVLIREYFELLRSKKLED